MSDNFIAGAVEHPGALRRYAKKKHTLNKDGTINLRETKAKAEKEKRPATRRRRVREVNLAMTLADLRR
jgi:hypothetical protein